jgi:O-antigen/teichoic acid export membrane protein
MDEVSSPIAWFSSLRRAVGLDRAVIFTVLARGWSSAAGLITVILIAHFLSATQQGYYYTFGSLVALQIVFELGFSFVILQMASHERAHLTISKSGEITGDPVAHARLASVLQKAVRWYSVAALLLLCTLAPAGIYFFSAHAQPGVAVSWKLPWLMVDLAASLAFQIDPMFSFLEGCGYVPQVAHMRFWQAFLGSLLAWTSLLLHHGLFAPAMLITGQVLVGMGWLFTRRGLLLGLFRHSSGHHRIQWGKEVWPFQWRIAISWICGYFIFQIFNPVLFAFWGPVAAGQMGMSLNISSALLAIAIAWVNTKSAPFGTMIARKEYAKLDETFFRALTQSLLVCVAGSITVWSVVVYLNLKHIGFAHRVLGPLPFGLLLLTMVVNQIVFSEALYLRAHKQEKFLMISILNALLMATSTYFLGKQFGAIGMISGYIVINTVVGLGLGTYTFLKYRNLWHLA